MKFFLRIALTTSTVFAFPQYSDLIPNGKSVPNPNPQGGIWAGVGHENAAGGGPLNPFGEDFRLNNFVWTEQLCQTDSDGDGRSNGVELGDPDCVWSPGDIPAEPSLSHPGLSDVPRDEPATSSCSNYEEPSTVVEYDVVFSQPTSMDETRTHYICEQTMMPVPSARVLHEIKSSVLLDNSEVLHHMFVFFCFDNPTDGLHVGEGPYACDGGESRCVRVAGWAVGPEESCLPPNIGAELDFTGMENVLVKIEAHYDNTSGQSQQDQSGMRLVYTPELRPLKADTAILGTFVLDNTFEIPPKQETYSLVNVCPSEATANLPEPIFVFGFAPHMHYYGRNLYTEHYRCGKKIGEVGRINGYEFDNQQSYDFPTPVKVLPGDALVTTCEYNTMTSDVPIIGGEQTSDEMCLNFIQYYPATDNFSLCSSFMSGINVDHLASMPGRTDGMDLNRLALLASTSFALTDSSPNGLVLNYENDPLSSWAPCCETDTCDEQYAAVEGGVCGTGPDCAGDLSCVDGFCAEATETSPPPQPSETEDAAQVTDDADEESGALIVSGGFSVLVLAFISSFLV